MRIHTDANGLAVNAISRLGDGTDVAGNRYDVLTRHRNFTIFFQNGSPQELGTNGLTNEAALAMLVHRLQHLDDKFPCAENKAAIQHLQAAMAALVHRQTARVEQGLVGTMEPHQSAQVRDFMPGDGPDYQAQVATLRKALGGLLNASTPEELEELERGIKLVAQVQGGGEDAELALQGVAAMLATQPGA